MSEYIVVLVTASSEKEAETIAEDLVRSRLVACANLINGIRSIYRWKNNVQKDDEVQPRIHMLDVIQIVAKLRLGFLHG